MCVVIIMYQQLEVQVNGFQTEGGEVFLSVQKKGLLYVKRYCVTRKAQMSPFSPSIQMSFEAVTYFGYLHECRVCSIMHLHMY